MFTAQGPTLRELAAQALSSIEHGYDLLAPKFDLTPFRTSDRLLDAVTGALRPLGPFGAGLDICCGTGAGMRVLRQVCRQRAVGVDFSAGMLAEATATVPPTADPPARPGTPAVSWVRADARALPFAPAFDLAVSFGAFGHFLPRERPLLFAQAYAALRPGGTFAFPAPAPPGPGSALYWKLLGFDVAMRVRNAVWRPRFVMYYRTFPLSGVLTDLRRAGFTVEMRPLTELGHLADGSPRLRLVVARKPAND
ncbi:class I SAM-dependent methyltransferase [Streptomyces peucetius]|uniref:Class I SAM-dependent methyltransferase n=1 Tax=Streptomyces peucetius TaxID=1950 RepID=A0ABY6IK78_STRPE|nr:class I SAM-dependent methyltransferase [Streptomyces peucetius]UYQ66100.1 class I SAM-dependent methyltransferase [Streptomyces peucetius]